MSRHRLTSLRRQSLSGGDKGSVWDLYATNGFLRPITNTNSSVKWVEDLDGTLVQSPANTPAMPGLRLATTVAEGALLGPELADDVFTALNQNANNSASISSGLITIISDGSVACGAILSDNLVAGETYQYQTTDVTVTYGAFKLHGSVELVPYIVSNVVGTFVATGTTLAVYRQAVCNVSFRISVKKVIPTWYSTDTDGSLISPISRMIRTAQGSVAEYDETYPGVLVEPAATNYLLNTATPATQTTGSLAAGTYTLWIEGAGSAAVTAGTATISGNGTASAGSPNTFTVSVAGTVTVTVTDPVTFFQLEGGAFPTSKIPTTTAAVTRAADNVSFATPSWLLAHPNDFAVIIRIKPLRGAIAGSPTNWLLAIGILTSDLFGVGIIPNATPYIVLYKAVASVSESSVIYLPVETDSTIEIIAYQSKVLGTGIAERHGSGGSLGEWSAFVTKGTSFSILDITAFNDAYIGSRGGLLYHFAATYPMTRIMRIPPNLSAAALQAWLVAKAGE